MGLARGQEAQHATPAYRRDARAARRVHRVAPGRSAAVAQSRIASPTSTAVIVPAARNGPKGTWSLRLRIRSGDEQPRRSPRRRGSRGTARARRAPSPSQPRVSAEQERRASRRRSPCRGARRRAAGRRRRTRPRHRAAPGRTGRHPRPTSAARPKSTTETAASGKHDPVREDEQAQVDHRERDERGRRARGTPGAPSRRRSAPPIAAEERGRCRATRSHPQRRCSAGRARGTGRPAPGPSPGPARSRTGSSAADDQAEDGARRRRVQQSCHVFSARAAARMTAKWRGSAGERLERQRGLVHEHPQPVGGRALPRAGRGQQRRLRRVVHGVEDELSRLTSTSGSNGGASPRMPIGVAFTTTSARGDDAVDGRRTRPRSPPGASAAAAAAASDRRAATTTRAPAPPSAWTIARAAPPAPRTTQQPAVGIDSPRRAATRTRPSPSVESPTSAAVVDARPC